MRQETLRGSARLILCVTCLLVTCSIARASEPEPTSLVTSEQSQTITREQCEKELTELEEISTAELTRLEIECDERLTTQGAECEERVRQAAEDAGAAAARLLLVELAGVTASRNAWRAVGLVAIIAAVLGWITAALT